MGERLRPAALRLAERLEERVLGLGQRLENLSYRRVLARGYALVRDTSGEAVTRAAATAPGMAIGIEFQDGAVGATIAQGAAAPTTEAASGGKPALPRARRAKRKDDQGTLL